MKQFQHFRDATSTAQARVQTQRLSEATEPMLDLPVEEQDLTRRLKTAERIAKKHGGTARKVVTGPQSAVWDFKFGQWCSVKLIVNPQVGAAVEIFNSSNTSVYFGLGNPVSRKNYERLVDFMADLAPLLK